MTDRVIRRAEGWYALVGSREFGPWPMQEYALAGLKTEQRRALNMARRRMALQEFKHYPGCSFRDPDNCSACALTDERQAAPNYAAWPLSYMQAGRAIPAQWRAAFRAEFDSPNKAYAANLRETMAEFGVRFTDGQPL